MPLRPFVNHSRSKSTLGSLRSSHTPRRNNRFAPLRPTPRPISKNPTPLTTIDLLRSPHRSTPSIPINRSPKRLRNSTIHTQIHIDIPTNTICIRKALLTATILASIRVHSRRTLIGYQHHYRCIRYRFAGHVRSPLEAPACPACLAWSATALCAAIADAFAAVEIPEFGRCGRVALHGVVAAGALVKLAVLVCAYYVGTLAVACYARFVRFAYCLTACAACGECFVLGC